MLSTAPLYASAISADLGDRGVQAECLLDNAREVREVLVHILVCWLAALQHSVQLFAQSITDTHE